MPPELESPVLEAPVATPSPAAAPVAAPPAAAEPPSLRETLEKAAKDNNLLAPSPDRETTQQNENRVSRQRDPSGKFVPKKAPEGAEVPSAEQVQAASDPGTGHEPGEDEGSQTDIEPMPNVDNAPKSWKAAAKDRWATVDPVVRAEVHRRERESTRAIQEHAPVKKFVGDFQQAIQPYAQHYAQSGVTPLALMRNLMSADVHLSTAPMADRAAFMAKLIGDYKIDIRMLDSALAGLDPSNEPIAGVEKLLAQRLAPIEQFVQGESQRRQQIVQQEVGRTQTELQRMEADTQNFPHFAMVRGDMADITEMALRRGIYLNAQQAYARAVSLNPEAQAAEQDRSGQQRAQVAHNAATRSLGASLSVSGNPSSVRQQVPAEDLRGTIAAAWEAAQGR